MSAFIQLIIAGSIGGLLGGCARSLAGVVRFRIVSWWYRRKRRRNPAVSPLTVTGFGHILKQHYPPVVVTEAAKPAKSEP